ncbi:class I SAM-dependent methyltransferase [Candidatus Latescibacterota bacterium]
MGNKTESNPWYEEYFGSDYLLIDVQRNTPKEVRFLRKVLNLKRGIRLLDVGCGYGRHLIPLVEQGIDIVGSDLSQFMLQETIRRTKAAAKISKRKINHLTSFLTKGPRLVRGDNRTLPFEGVFDCACNMFNSFGYYHDERDNYRMLVSVAQALKPGGLFLLDLVNRDFVLRLDSRKDWFERNGAVILEDKWYDPILNRSEIDVTVIDKKGKRNYHHSIRLYSLTELTMLLEAAGFEVIRVYGGFDGNEFDLEQDRMLILARAC